MSESNLPLRTSCRSLVFNADGLVLLAQHRVSEGTVWVGPGGGVEDGETLVEALERELTEETGLVLVDPAAPALVWTQEHEFPEMEPHGYSGVIGHFFVAPLSAFTREAGSPADAHEHPYEDGMLDMRWWSLDEVQEAHRRSVLFSPREFPRLMRDLLDPARFDALKRAPLSLGL